MTDLLRRHWWRDAASTMTAEVAEGIARFPVPALACLIGFAFSYFELARNEALFRGLATALCGALLFMCLEIFRERLGWRLPLLYLVGLPLLAGIGWLFFQSPEPHLPFPFLAGGLLLLGFAAPYLRPGAPEAAFWTYCFRIGLLGAFAGLGSLILFLGGLAIIESLEFLFGLDLDPLDLQTLLLNVVGFLVFPIAVLAGFPKAFDDEITEYPRPVKIIVSYVLIPLVAIYTLILYAYMAKIALAGELPEGQVAYLVLGYALVGVLTFLASYPIGKDAGIARVYQRGFFPLLLAPLVLLGLAVGIRINAYGVTEDRYMLVLCLVWLVIAAGLGILLSRARASVLIVSVLAVLSLAASFGPWGAVEVSARSQLGRLEGVLARSGLLGDGKGQHRDAEMSRDDQIVASGILDYLSASGKLTRIGPLLGEEASDRPTLTSRTQREAAAGMLGFDYIPSIQRGDHAIPFQYNIARAGEAEAVTQVTGYDYLVDVMLHPLMRDEKKAGPPFEVTLGGRAMVLDVRYRETDRSVTVEGADGGALLEFDLAPLITTIERAKMDGEFTRDEAVLEARSEVLKGQLIVEQIAGEFRAGEERPKVRGITGKLLLRSAANTKE